MNNDHDTNVNMTKLLISWVGVVFGSISLQNVVLWATLIYTVLNIYLLLRRMWKERFDPPTIP